MNQTNQITDLNNSNLLIFNCPHCNDFIHVYENEINCTIFRHAIYKDNYEQINPHTPKSECNRLASENLVYGCAKPFRILKNNENKYYIQICEYI